MSRIRYIAEWIVEEAEDPAESEYETQEFADFDDAEAYAEAQATAGPVSWWRVTEQTWDPNYYEPGVGSWEDSRCWVEGVEIPVE